MNEQVKKDYSYSMLIAISLLLIILFGALTLNQRYRLPHLAVGINDTSVTVKVNDDHKLLLPGFYNRGSALGSDDFVGKMVLFSPERIQTGGSKGGYINLLEVMPKMTVPSIWVIENWDRQGGYGSHGANRWEWENIIKVAQSDLDLTIFLTTDYDGKTNQFSHVSYTCRTIKDADGKWINDWPGVQFNCAPDN